MMGKRKAGTNEDNENEKRSKEEINEERPRMFVCGEEGCEFESKWKGHLKRHKAMVHDIDVLYYLCNSDGCEYKAKSSSNLNQHRKNIHRAIGSS